jgi:YHS domain-containing protein
MYIIRNLVIGAVLIAIVAFTAGAEQAKGRTITETSKELKSQTHCLVMGGEIDSTVFADIQGQRVYYCCQGCMNKFKADPDKYFKKAAAEGVLFENIQTTCPVSGKELKDKSVFADYEGRRIVFCCQGCIGRFMENPQKYLKQMDQSAKPEQEESMKDNKADHSSCQDQSGCGQ